VDRLTIAIRSREFPTVPEELKSFGENVIAKTHWLVALDRRRDYRRVVTQSSSGSVQKR
jgi:hypothetical protein